MKLNFCITCGNAFTDNEGRLNVIGTFDVIYANESPAVHNNMYIVTRWLYETEQERTLIHNQKIEIVEESTETVIATVPFKIPSQRNSTKYFQVISSFNNLLLPSFGKYLIRIYLNDREITSDTISDFEVIQKN